MTPFAKYGLVALAALVIGVLLQRGRDAKAAVRTEIVRLTHEKRVLDTLYRVDTVRLVRWETRYATAHDTVLAHLTDTVVVKQFVATADSTIRACTAALHDCDRLRAVNDSLVTAYAKLAPRFLDRIGVNAGPGCVSTLAGKVSCGVAVGVTIKVWP